MFWHRFRKTRAYKSTKAGYCPRVEQLEDRTVPSVVDQVVNVLFAEHWTDNGLGDHPDTSSRRQP